MVNGGVAKVSPETMQVKLMSIPEMIMPLIIDYRCINHGKKTPFRAIVVIAVIRWQSEFTGKFICVWSRMTLKKIPSQLASIDGN